MWRGIDLRLGWHVGLAALCLTLLNGLKPMHIDDTFIFEVARQIQASPLNPYGFDIFWLQWPQPVYEELTPPVVPYWWALGLSWLPSSVLAWKLWFFPFAATLGWGLAGILARRIPGREAPFVWCALLSPVVLPGFNFMQDIPAMALALAGVRIYLDAADRNRLDWAAAAGLVAGLATQTKYTAVATLGAILVHGWLYRRKQAAVVAASVAVLVFFGWEWAMTVTYGQGMFLGQVNHGLFWVPRLKMIVPMLQQVGGVAVLLIPLGLHRLGVPSRWVAISAPGLIAIALGLPAGQPASTAVTLGVLGCAVFLFGGLAAARTFRDESKDEARWMVWLTIWAAIELAVYFASAPFPAARRVIGICTLLFLIGVAALARHRPFTRAAGACLFACSISVGCLFQVVDLLEARAQQRAARWAAELHRTAGQGLGRLWFVGHWGFQFYAEEAGMQPVVPDGSQLRSGDWIAIPSVVDRQEIRLNADQASELYARRWEDPLPWSTLPGYYGGFVPIRGVRGSRFQLSILELQQDVVPPSAWSALRLADWARRAGGRTAAAAAPALFRTLEEGNAEDRRRAIAGIASLQLDPVLDPPRLIELLGDSDPSVRLGTVICLSRFSSAAVRQALESARADPDPAVAAAAAMALVGPDSPEHR